MDYLEFENALQLVDSVKVLSEAIERGTATAESSG